jgi:hypothetical protein
MCQTICQRIFRKGLLFEQLVETVKLAASLLPLSSPNILDELTVFLLGQIIVFEQDFEIAACLLELTLPRRGCVG